MEDREEVQAADAGGKEITYKSQRGITRAVLILFAVVAAIDVGVIVSDVFYAQAGDRGDMNAILELDELLLIPSIVSVVPGLALVVVFVIWQYGATRNVIAYHGPVEGLSPGWAVGWWFVPVANLFQPCRYVFRLYKLSTSPRSVAEHDDGGILIGIWWFMYLVSVIVGYRVTRNFSDAVTPSGVAEAAGWDIGVMLAEILAISLIAVIVRRIAAAQTALFETAAGS